MAVRSKTKHTILLAEAWEVFAPKALIARRDAARSTPLILAEHNDTAGRIEIVKGMLGIVGAGIDHFRLQQEPIFEMRRHLVEQLVKGKLVASGYRTKPSVSTTIEAMPAVIFSNAAAISWHESAIEVGGQRFELITVAKPNASEASIRAPAASQAVVPQSRPGRPSKIEIINEIIDELQKLGVQLNSKPRGVARALIIEAALKTGRSKSDEGLSVPVIQRALYRKFGKRV